MTAFQYKETCYPSENEALSAFISSHDLNSFYVPAVDVVSTYSVVNTSVNSLGLISYSLRYSSGSLSNVFTYQLHPCDSLSSSYVFDKMPVQDMIFAAAFVLVFVVGIFQGHKS